MNYLTNIQGKIIAHVNTHIRPYMKDTSTMTPGDVAKEYNDLISGAIPIPSESIEWLSGYFRYVRDVNQTLVYNPSNGLWHYEKDDITLKNTLTDYFTTIYDIAKDMKDAVTAKYAMYFLMNDNKLNILTKRIKTSVSFMENKASNLVTEFENYRYFNIVGSRKRMLIDLSEDTFNPREVTYQDTQHMHLMHIAPQKIDISGDPVEFLRLIDEYMLHDPVKIEYFHKVLAYMMSPYNYNQVLLYWIGSGRNGKGTITKVIQDILGPHSVRMNAELLNARPTSSFKKDDALAATEGRSLLVFNEIDERMEASTQNIKDLTEGGRDEYGNKVLTVVRPAFKPNYEINICGTPLIVANSLINFGNWSQKDPIFKRLVLVSWDYAITLEDPDVPNRLAKEYPKIQAWLYKNYFKYKNIKLKSEPKPNDFQIMFDQYKSDSDVLQMFWDQCIDVTNKSTDLVVRSDLYRMYVQYCKANGMKPIRHKGPNGFENLVKNTILKNITIVNHSGTYKLQGVQKSKAYVDEIEGVY